MKFDLKKYRKAKQKAIELIKNSHNWETTEGFIADGLISPEIYNKQDLKIICLLGESYGYDECKITEIETQLEKNVLGVGYPSRKTGTKIPILLWLIYESIKNHEKIKWDDFPNLMRSNEENINILQNAISKSAWINVKKASRHIEDWGNDATRQNYNEIYKHSLRNEEVLKVQIESMSPDLMIVCSDPVFNSLYDMGLLGQGVEQNQKYVLQTNSSGQKVIQVNHPSYFRDWGYKGIYEIFEIIYDGLNSTHNKS